MTTATHRPRHVQVWLDQVAEKLGQHKLAVLIRLQAGPAVTPAIARAFAGSSEPVLAVTPRERHELTWRAFQENAPHVPLTVITPQTLRRRKVGCTQFRRVLVDARTRGFRPGTRQTETALALVHEADQAYVLGQPGKPDPRAFATGRPLTALAVTYDLDGNASILLDTNLPSPTSFLDRVMASKPFVLAVRAPDKP